MNEFYVYEHIRLDTNQVFYVGKGKGNRANRTYGRNNYWNNIVNKYGFRINYVCKNIDEELSFLVEQERIDQLVKIGLNLCNMTKGGDGVSGIVFSDKTRLKMRNSRLKYDISKEARAKISKANKGKKHSKEWVEKIATGNRGKKRTLEQRNNISKAKSKKVFCIDSNKEFSSAEEAANHYGFTADSIRKACSGHRKTSNKMMWKYI